MILHDALVSVSIHASARDATRPQHDSCRAGKVSIHASARDATSCAKPPYPYFPKFQSTRPRGTRLVPQAPIFTARMFQSTRPRGTRPGSGVRLADRRGFNPRVRAGRDLRLPSAARCLFGFNPRVRAGRDRRFLSRCWERIGFNPRVRAGRDRTTAISF